MILNGMLNICWWLDARGDFNPKFIVSANCQVELHVADFLVTLQPFTHRLTQYTTIFYRKSRSLRAKWLHCSNTASKVVWFNDPLTVFMSWICTSIKEMHRNFLVFSALSLSLCLSVFPLYNTDKRTLTTRFSYPLTMIPAGSENIRRAISFRRHDKKRPGFCAWNVVWK